MKAILRLLLGFTILATLTLRADAADIRVFAAASLTEAFKAIGTAYERVDPFDHVDYSFGGSPTLRTQIQQGAQVDIFASADRPNMDVLTAAHLAGSPVIFARNTLVVIAPSSSTTVNRISDLAGNGVRVVLAGPKVPAGRYAEEILAKMTPGIASNFNKSVMANVVSREIDVKAVVAKVQLGEADAGIVFATDAIAAGSKVRTIPIPAKYNVTAEYPIAVLSSSTIPVIASKFIAFINSPAGQSILRAHGFLSGQAAQP
ncbi:MAG: molybdate ABC transporter substrate-binding protein [Capsulimonadaceae bacterium]|nr:molybdate ABC transporter substrate-binding protein [Capsulimonadaceae bacterium]